jgi:hypothetical protein
MWRHFWGYNNSGNRIFVELFLGQIRRGYARNRYNSRRIPGNFERV